jgi:hypothetical protein
VSTAQDHHATNASTAAHNLGVGSQRADQTANLGDDLEGESTRLAPRLSQSQGVSDGM